MIIFPGKCAGLEPGKAGRTGLARLLVKAAQAAGRGFSRMWWHHRDTSSGRDDPGPGHCRPRASLVQELWDRGRVCPPLGGPREPVGSVTGLPALLYPLVMTGTARKCGAPVGGPRAGLGESLAGSVFPAGRRVSPAPEPLLTSGCEHGSPPRALAVRTHVSVRGQMGSHLVRAHPRLQKARRSGTSWFVPGPVQPAASMFQRGWPKHACSWPCICRDPRDHRAGPQARCTMPGG